MQKRNHLLVIAGPRVVDDFDAAEIGARLPGGRANPIFAAQDRDLRQTLARGSTGGGDNTRIFAFGKNDVLRISGGALTNLIKYGHDSGQSSVVSCQFGCWTARANLSRDGLGQKLACMLHRQLDSEYRGHYR